MITRLGMGGGEEIEETPSNLKKEDLMGNRAIVTRGSRGGQVVEIVAEVDGQTTAVWTDPEGQEHRFRAPSNMFEPVATRKRASRAKKKKDD